MIKSNTLNKKILLSLILIGILSVFSIAYAAPTVTVSNIEYGNNASISISVTSGNITHWGVTDTVVQPISTATTATNTGNVINQWYPVSGSSASIAATFTKPDAGELYAWAKDSSGNTTSTKFTVSRKSIVVTPNYDIRKEIGDLDPTISYTYTGNLSGEIPGFKGSLSRESGEDAGFYLISKGTLELIDNNNFKAGNYNLVFSDEKVHLIISYTEPITLKFNITSTASNELILPIPANTTNKYMVEWGDNNSEVYEGVGFPKHKYSSSGEYNVTISGVIKNFGYSGTLKPDANNLYKDYLNYIQQLTGIVKLGDISADTIGFAFCQNLTGTIPATPAEGVYLSKLKSAENMFSNCSSLTGSIPASMLRGATEVKSAKNMFLNCENLTGSIPADLFSDTTKITSFESTFNNCKNLSGAIPENLFSNATLNTTFAGTFKDCVNLAGPLSEKLFSNSRLVNTFKETFYNCQKINTTISSKLFEANRHVQNYYRTFYRCYGITGTIPRNTFITNTVIASIPEEKVNSNFRGTFEECTGINNVEIEVLIIGHEMFKGCTNLKSVELTKTIDIGDEAFAGCNALNQIRSDREYLRSIGKNSFNYTGAASPFPTAINSDNEVLKNYNWAGDKRGLDIEAPKGSVDIKTKIGIFPFTKQNDVTLEITLTDNYAKSSNCKMAILNEDKYEDFARSQYQDYDTLPWENYSATKAWTLTANDGLKTVYVFFRDDLGNTNMVYKRINIQ